jgi:hypothetical protein
MPDSTRFFELAETAFGCPSAVLSPSVVVIRFFPILVIVS